MRPNRSSAIRWLLVCIASMVLIGSGGNSGAANANPTATAPSQPQAVVKTYGPGYIYTANGIYRAKIYVTVATNDAKTVNDVRRCWFVMQKKFGGGLGWLNYAWNDQGWTIIEYDATTKSFLDYTTKTGDGPSAIPTLANMRVGNNLPASHRVGCSFHVPGGQKGFAVGQAYD